MPDKAIAFLKRFIVVYVICFLVATIAMQGLLLYMTKYSLFGNDISAMDWLRFAFHVVPVSIVLTILLGKKRNKKNRSGI